MSTLAQFKRGAGLSEGLPIYIKYKKMIRICRGKLCAFNNKWKTKVLIKIIDAPLLLNHY